MRVQNKSRRAYQHGEYLIKPGKDLVVPDKIAKMWLATGDIIEYVDPAEAKKAAADAAKKQAELEDENAKLKAELEKAKAEAKAAADAAKKAKTDK